MNIFHANNYVNDVQNDKLTIKLFAWINWWFVFYFASGSNIIASILSWVSPVIAYNLQETIHWTGTYESQAVMTVMWAQTRYWKRSNMQFQKHNSLMTNSFFFSCSISVILVCRLYRDKKKSEVYAKMGDSKLLANTTVTGDANSHSNSCNLGCAAQSLNQIDGCS